MSKVEIISLVVTLVCVASFSVVFTILFRNYYVTNIDAVKKGREDLDLIENAIYEERENRNRGRKTLRLVGRISEYVILGAISAFFLFSLISRFMGNNLPLGKYSMMVIATDSMSLKNSNNTYLEEYDLNNQFNAYDIIGISPYESQNDVQLYDVVAYKDNSNTIIVHRIRAIETRDGEIVYHTRGDKNAIDDDNNRYGAYLTYDRIIGHYNGNRIQDLGIFVIFVQSNAGIITIVSIVYCLLMYDRFNNKYAKAVAERTEALRNQTGFDPSKADISEFKIHYRESLEYGGNQYVYENGTYVCTLGEGETPLFQTPVAETPEPQPESQPKGKRSSRPKLPKEEKPKKKKEYDSFLDHLDDTEEIL